MKMIEVALDVFNKTVLEKAFTLLRKETKMPSVQEFKRKKSKSARTSKSNSKIPNSKIPKTKLASKPKASDINQDIARSNEIADVQVSPRADVTEKTEGAELLQASNEEVNKEVTARSDKGADINTDTVVGKDAFIGKEADVDTDTDAEIKMESEVEPKETEKKAKKLQLPKIFGVSFGAQILKSKFPKSFGVAEKVVNDWINDGDFKELPIDAPIVQYYVGEGLRRAKEVEKKIETRLDEAGVLPIVKHQVGRAQKWINKK